MHSTSNFFHFKRWEFYLIFAVVNTAIIYITNTYITNANFYYSAFSDQFSSERIDQIMAVNHKYLWLTYIVAPVMIFIKINLIAGLIYIGIFIFNFKISYQNCVKIVLLAEIATILKMLTSTAYLYFNPPLTLKDTSFSPLALTQVINVKHFPDYVLYPLQLFNLFEVAYWVLLIIGIAHFTKSGAKKSFLFIASTYGIGLFIWILIVMFIQVQVI
jgi:hypothetical protein